MQTYRDYPVLGDAFGLLPNLKQTLISNWQGHVIRVAGPPDTLTLRDFYPQDKAIPGVYGVDQHGNVVCSITFYSGDKYSRNPIEKDKHWQFCKTDRTEAAF